MTGDHIVSTIIKLMLHKFYQLPQFFSYQLFTFLCLICSVGYFIEPTIVQSKDPKDKIMTEEIFGPVLSIYVYKDKELDNILELIDKSTVFALTGAVFAQDQYVNLCNQQI